MINKIQNITFKSSIAEQNIKNNENNTGINRKVTAGAIIGTLLPLVIMAKSRKIKNPLKMKYSKKDMVIMSGSSIAGGTIAEMINENQEIRKNKFKKSVSQFLNTSITALFVAGMLKLCKTEYYKDSTISKVSAIAFGILAGMYTASKVVNIIFNSDNTERKLSPKDYLANVDDAGSALAIVKFPKVQNLHINKALPTTYNYCGYRTGNTN